MTIFEAAVLALIQGLTELLPVSSSGHLVILQSFFPGFSQPGVFFDVVLHLGTLFAVVWYFRKVIMGFKMSFLPIFLIGTIPAATVGLLFSDFFEGLFSNTVAVGIGLIITGTLNFFTDRLKSTGKTIKTIKSTDALFIGIFQAIAITPGISRSGSTIFAGVLRGIKKEDAAAFSFLLSIPAIFGAICLQVIKHQEEVAKVVSHNYVLYSIGFLISFTVSYLTIDIFLKLIRSFTFRVFAVYCWTVGTLLLFANLYHLLL